MWSQGTGERGLGSGEDSRGGGFGRFWQDLTVAGGCWGRRGSVGSRAGEGGERRAARSPASPPARPASEGAAARSEFGIAGGPTQGYPAFLVVFPRPPLPPLPPAQSSETPRPLLVYSGGGRPLGPGAAAGPGGRERARGILGGPQVRAAPVAGLRLPGRRAEARGLRPPGSSRAQVHPAPWVSQEKARFSAWGFLPLLLLFIPLEELFIDRNSLFAAGSFDSRCPSRGWNPVQSRL